MKFANTPFSARASKSNGVTARNRTLGNALACVKVERRDCP